MKGFLFRAGVAALGLVICCKAPAVPDPPAAPKASQVLVHAAKRRALRGKASVYSRRLAHRPMADGTPLDPDADVAASKQLPLGSRARVTNLRNGRSAEVEIRDRGPYVPGRIIDLSPRTAAKLGFKDGVVPVEVTPLGARGRAAAAAPTHMQGPQP
jgi:rare lipoprotein A